VKQIKTSFFKWHLVYEHLETRCHLDFPEQYLNTLYLFKGGMGTAWDIAYTTLFLASDEAKFITSVIIPVDGEMMGRVGL
jgi:NAD(P)-dependent dehydrogenase (short-subunit alcohol dehydrogenase family)